MRRFILVVNVIAPLAAIALWPVSPLAAVCVLAIAHALILYPTLAANVQWFGPVVTSFVTSEQEAWLTIDDGPTGDTKDVLNLLEKRGVKATFFLKGTLAEKEPDLVREILQRGHTIGNHSWSHPSATFWCLLPRGIRAEIERCNEALSAITSSAPRWFRAPVGMKNPAVHPVLERNGMSLIGWTARGFDSTTNDAELVARRVVADIRPGAIVLLHQGRESSVRVIDRAVGELQARGYSFVLPDAGRLKTNG